MDQETLDRLGLAPPEGHAEPGRDVRLEPNFLALQGEIEKLSALTGVDGGVDWDLVISEAATILGRQSKDVMAASYMAVGLLETQGFAGLAPGAKLLADLLETFWESLFPPLKRLRARANALSWWSEKTAVWLKANAETPRPADEIEKTVTAVKRLDALMADKDLPTLLEILRLVSALPLAASPQPPAGGAPAATAPPVAPADSSSAAAPAAASSLVAPQDAAQARRQLLGAAAAWLRLAGPDCRQDPWFWKLSRLVLWFGVSGPPPSEGGRTMIPAPPDEAFGNVAGLLSGGKFEAALAAAEELTGTYLFWLDLHRASHLALTGLGLTEAAAVVAAEARALAVRWPALTLLTFDDGAPMTSPETKQWLQSRDESAAVDAENQKISFKKLAEGEPTQALIRLSQPENQPRDGRDLFRRRIVEAELWGRLGRNQVAASMAQWLLDRSAALHLESWEPDLASEACAAACGVFRRLGPTYAEKAGQAASRLAFTDPQAALILAPADPG
ncbi:MAG: type VI secretion system protein TssA [Deltaproteobacteria bacterium]|jgi:type VI secretion system protein VasJ|nr:type VI secretion system protein TssA [Deltaproteobacteria bacterium]